MTELSDYYLERLGSHNPAAEPIRLRVGANTVGRQQTNNIILCSKYASRRHCTIYVTDTDQIMAKNDAATNGIFINGTQRIDRDVEICLNLNDIVGIGCDTSKEEIVDTECFIFKIKRNNVEIKTDEIISLEDSDEEEYKILEEYSQMNLSAMKQEYMECEDLVEVLSSSKNDTDIGYVPIDNPVSEVDEYGKIDANDMIDEIIANSSKSYAEKTEMIRNVVPDVSSFLMKDCAVGENGEPSDSAIRTKDCPVGEKGEPNGSAILSKDCDVGAHDRLPSNHRKRTKEETKESKTRVKTESRTRLKKESSDRKHDQTARKRDRKDSKAAKEQCDEHKNVIRIEKSPSPQMKELQVTIPISHVVTSTAKRRKSSSAQERTLKDSSNRPIETNHERELHRRNSSVSSPGQIECQNDSKALAARSKSRNSSASSTSTLHEASRNEPTTPTGASNSKIFQRRYTHVPSSTQKEWQNNTIKPPEATYSRIQQRRQTFVPSSTLSSGATKRQVEIITAPHMIKRRKSISAMPEPNVVSSKAQNTDAKWLSKIVQHKNKRRSLEEKNEIKSKLAALVPKDKVPETKIVRTNTKIPVKNTHRTRNDQLTDTIVRTIIVSRKHKLNGTAVPVETCKIARTNGQEVASGKPIAVEQRRPSIVQREVVKATEAKTKAEEAKTKATEVKPKATEVKSNAAEVKPKDAEVKPKSAEMKSKPTEAKPKSNLVRREPTEVQPNNDQSKNHHSSDPTVTVTSADAAATTAVVKSILKKPNSIQKRRATVTFAEESRVKIRTFSSASPAAATTVRSEEDNIDDVIHNIMALGMSALKGSSSALINGKNFSYKTVAHEYDSIGHLQNVFVPLMKAELWKEIEDGYAYSKNTTATNVQMNYCSRDENHPNRYKCHCEALSPGAIQNGALVLMLGVHSGKEFLGYITNRQITNKVCYFQFVTACSVESNGSSATPLKLKPIMYVRPNLKVFEALFKLKNSPLLDHILHPRQNYTKPQKQQFQYKGYNSLNQDQMITLSSVYRKCIVGRPFISLIEGPPGTGKSRLVTNLVLQLLYGKEITQPLKILVCAPSNAAVDILTKNLMDARKKYVIEKGQKKMKLVRFGVLEKMDASVRNFSIQCLTSHNEKTKLVEQNRLMECKKKKEAELAAYSAKHAREKITAIRKEISAIEAIIKNLTYDEKCLLEGANVICTTLNSCCALSSKISKIDICIIDEATQCNEPTSLIPLQFGVKSLVLVGDTKQLPSTVLSDIAKQYNYDQSLFQRLQKSFEAENKFESPILQLTTQYRMHPDILHWPNQYFYKNQLTSADQNDKFALKLKPYTVFNLNYVQSMHTAQKHISNVDEAKFVCNLLDFLLKQADPQKFSYGIISAYSQQKNDLAKQLSTTYPYVTVNTIDSCQGQERDIVIISIARTRGIGFLAIRQRLNVALTRAKKMLILCGNFNSLQSHPMWTSLLDDARQRKLYINFPPTIDDSSLSSYFQNTLTT